MGANNVDSSRSSSVCVIEPAGDVFSGMLYGHSCDRKQYLVMFLLFFCCFFSMFQFFLFVVAFCSCCFVCFFFLSIESIKYLLIAHTGIY